MLVAGDIGGTKTDLGIYSTEKGPQATIIEASFPSGEYQGLEMIVREFLAGASVKVNRASFGVAGPVVGGQAKITNLPWFSMRHNYGRRSI
jgi:glucokinase